MGAGIIGAKPGSTMAMATDGRAFGVGDLYEDSSGNQWVFVKASASFGQYDVVTYDETYNTTVAALSTSNDARGDKCGVAAVAFASGDYGWLQIYGPCTMNVKASCAANVRINTTTTAGSLDDDGTTGSIQVEGIYLTAARTTTDGSAAGILNYPIQGATL